MTRIRGIAYPLTLEGGSLRIHTDEELVRDAILSVLQTQVGERAMLPQYGTERDIFTAAKDLPRLLQDIESRLFQQVAKDYPSTQFRVSGVLDDSGALSMRVDYSISGVPQPPLTLRGTRTTA